MKWFWTQRAESAEEIQSHLAERADNLMESGLPREEAVQQARREFGNPALITEASRAVWGWRWLDRLHQDLRYAIRMLLGSPGFTAVAVLSLALGIGANTAIFTLAESAIWKPIPVKNPERLRQLWWQGTDGVYDEFNVWGLPTQWGDAQPTPDGGVRHTAFTYPIYKELQRSKQVFESLFGFLALRGYTAVVDGSAERVNCFLVTGSFYRDLGVVPILGRPIHPEDDVRTAAGSVALISYDYWTRRFGRDVSVIGKTVTLNQAPLTIIGVNPQDFTGIAPGWKFEIWATLHVPPTAFPMNKSPLDGNAWWLPLMGRLKRGVSDDQAQRAVDAIFKRQVDSDFPGMNAALKPFLTVESGARGMDQLGWYGKPLLILLALSGLVLLIACANVANLLLAKSAARRREISLRLALGAGQSRIVRQLLTEGMLLASIAGAAGMIFGYWARNSIPALLATSWRPSPLEPMFDLRVLIISLGITFLTGILFSLAPVRQARRVEVHDALKDGSRGTAGVSKLRMGKLLVVFQVALSLVLLAGAGLFLKTYTNLRANPLGFQPERVLLFLLDPPAWRYSSGRTAVLLTQIQERAATIPGVQSATFSTLPLLSQSSQLLQARVTLAGEKGFSMALRHEVGSRFFETMGIPILNGRPVDERDGPGKPPVVVVNTQFARFFFHTDSPLGKTFTDHSGIRYEIVGVCGAALDGGLGRPVRPTYFRYFPQTPRVSRVTFELKIAGDTTEIVRQIRGIVGSLDPELAMLDIRSQAEQVASTLSQERLLASLGAVFGGLALVLACIGIFGVMAYSVMRRTSEIGIRVALGAVPGRVTWMVLRETLLLAAAGVVLGVPGAMALSRFTQSFLYGMKPNDPVTFASAALMLAISCAIAGYLPARRASRVDPMVALRHD